MSIHDKGLYFIEGLRIPETPAPGAEPEPWQKTRVVGGRATRVDGYERVSGTAVYPSDVVLPGMLHGAILRCPHPSARVLKVDTRGAEKMPGVRAVLTDRSPEVEGITWNRSKDVASRLFDPDCRFEGETVAAVAADTPHQAWDAVRAIEVQYEVRPYVVDEQDALAGDAPKVGPGGNEVSRNTQSRGDVDKGFAEADVVLEETYHTAAELHTPLELHGSVCRWDGDALTVWESTQGVFAVQSRVAEVLKLPLAKVRVIGHYMGGGFGSKLRTSKHTIIGALLARKTARPVKLFLTREETFLAMGNRPPTTLTLKAGVKKDGTLTALDFKGIGASGAYPAGGAAQLDWLVRDLYTCPNVRTETVDVLINAGPARPFRAPGHPQTAWALEQMMDALAEKIGMDPVALRLKNVPSVSQGREGQPPYTSTGLEACIRQGAQAFGWEAARGKKRPAADGALHRGVGMASCLWVAGGGGPPSTVIVKLFSDGSVNLNMGASDIGTGTKTVMALVVAEELGVDPQDVQIENADTGTTQYATPSGGSKTVPTEAPTVRAAALDVKRQLLDMAAEDLGVARGDLTFEGAQIVTTRGKKRSLKITEVSTLDKRGVVVGVGYRGPNPVDKVVNPFAAQFCEVEVNTRTGEVRLVRFVAAHESGRVMDRLTYDNQVIGGVTMGVGFALTENRVLDRARTGKLVSKSWHDYKLPTALDVPDAVESVPIDRPDPEANISGAKGLGEPVTIPTAAAIANAVHHAIGVRMTDTFVNPTTLVARLEEEG